MEDKDLPEGIQGCTCYQAKPDDVEAYFSGYCNPAVGNGPDYYDVKIKLRSGEWIDIYRKEGYLTAMPYKATEWKIAEIILWSYCGNQKLVGHTALAKKLRDWKAHDLRRITPHEIRLFLVENQKPMP